MHLKIFSFTFSLLLLSSLLSLNAYADGSCSTATAVKSHVSEVLKKFLGDSRGRPNFNSSETFWVNFSQEFTNNVPANLKRWQTHYDLALLNNHPHIDFLRSLEFQIVEGSIIAPNLNHVMEKLHGMLLKLVEDGIVLESDLLFPAQVFRKGDEYIGLLFGEPIPEGFVPATGIVPNKAFAKLVSEGRFPVGNASLTVDKGQLMFLHDLGHFSGFIAHPLYMKNLKAAYTQATLITQYDGYSVQKLMNIVTESVVTVTPVSSFEAGLKKFGILVRSSKDPLVPTEYLEQIQDLATNQISEVTELIVLNHANMLNPVGGRERDIVTSAEERRLGFAKERDIGGLIFQLKRNETKENLAIFLSAYDYFSRAKPEDFPMIAISPDRANSNKFFEDFICKSGIWNPNQTMYSSFCK